MLEKQDRGYWLGDAELFGLKWHVECIQVRAKRSKTRPCDVRAVNGRYQEIVGRWLVSNLLSAPRLGVAPNGNPAFYHMEVYAE
jgi:hypothetical protein